MDDNTPVILQQNPIKPTNSCKFLGVHLDPNMSFTVQNRKIPKHTGILYKIKDLLPLRTRLVYYFAFKYPYQTYDVLVWGTAYPCPLATLITQHKRTIRTIANSGYLDHTNPLFIKLGLLKFQDI